MVSTLICEGFSKAGRILLVILSILLYKMYKELFMYYIPPPETQPECPTCAICQPCNKEPVKNKKDNSKKEKTA